MSLQTFTKETEVLEDSPLIALAQPRFQVLDVFLERPAVCNVTDTLNMRARVPNSFLRLHGFARPPLGASGVLVSRSITILSFASARASPLHPHPGNLRSCGSTTSSALCSKAVVKAV